MSPSMTLRTLDPTVTCDVTRTMNTCLSALVKTRICARLMPGSIMIKIPKIKLHLDTISKALLSVENRDDKIMESQKETIICPSWINS